jgi:hypothetical protein
MHVMTRARPCCSLLETVDRDIYSIGLKTLIMDVPPPIGERISTVVTTQLLRGLGPDSAVIAECLEILGEMLKRFGYSMEREHHQLMTRFLASVRDLLPLALALPLTLPRVALFT